MQFFTTVPIAISTSPISYQSRIVSLGSCFAENIADKLHFYQFQNTVNPFGIIFNPISIEKIIRRAIHKDFFSEKDIFFHNESWHSFEVHSALSHPEKDFFLKKLNIRVRDFFHDISTATHLTLTLGTSWVYKSNASREIVANCHKVPQKEFSKQLLSVAEINQSLINIVNLVREINSDCHFIFTISPVRHIKDGFVENQISKSNLISAVYNLVQNQLPESTLSYFPSYEIMMDELRDYRFYSEDLLHPNTTAIDYIWSKFSATTVEKTSYSTMNDVETIQKGLQHRSFNAASISHQKFLKNLDEKIEKMQSKHPFMKF